MTENKQIPYSKYTSKYNRHLASDYSLWKYSNFTDLIDLDMLKQLFVNRNNSKGTQYRIIDLFGKDLLFYLAFLNDGAFNIIRTNSEYRYYLYGNRVKVDTVLMRKLFPRGIPQTYKQLNQWINYLAYLAHQKFF